LGIAICLLYLPPLQLSPPSAYPRKQSIIKGLIIIFLLPVSYHFCRKILDATPLQIESADMLPIIKVMGQRFLRGDLHAVYSPIIEIWNGIQPIYLPVLWMAFLPALIFDFDLRWITVTGIWLSVMTVLYPVILKIRKGQSFILLTALLVLLCWFHFDEENNVVRLTEEGVIFVFYSLMVYAIVSGRAWLIGLGAAFCLLSRYALIGWIPCAVLFWLWDKEYLKITKAFFAGAIVILLLLVIPFGWPVIKILLKIPGHYIEHAQKVWERSPEEFYDSLGMARFFGPSGITTLHFILVAGTFLCPLLFLGYYLMKKKTGKQYNNFLLASFQLSLTFFYNFLDVSYLYLYYTPVFVSLVIASLSLANNMTRSKGKSY
jgi:hypothetical protein